MAAPGRAIDSRRSCIRNIYNNADRRYLVWMEPFVDAGYAVVIAGLPRPHDSDGIWDPYMCELTDGFDTHEWVGRQPWCDGQVGDLRRLVPGVHADAAGDAAHPHLKALVPIASQQDNWGHIACPGAIHWSVATFFATMIGRTHAVRAAGDWSTRTRCCATCRWRRRVEDVRRATS